MSRRIPSASAAFWTALTLVVILGSCLIASPTFAGEMGSGGGDESVMQETRHSIDNPPEVIEPGDDDQPTIGKKRGVVICAPAPGSAATAVRTPSDDSESMVSGWVKTIRAFVGRLGSMLRLPS